MAEVSESNNSASRQVEVRGNKVQNGDFEASANGTAPDHWQGSGSTSYDGHTAGAGPGGTWTSAPIAVTPGARYGFDLTLTGSGSALVQQLSPAGVVLASAPPGLLTAVLGATQVRVVLAGGLGGLTTFDDVRLWED